MSCNKKPALVVMAAGMGSRFGGLKQLEPVGQNGEILLEYSVHDAIKAGFGRVIFIINSKIEQEFKEKIASKIPSSIKVDYCIQDPMNIPEGIEYPPERKKPWGTGHAIMSLKGTIDESFAVINADDYYGTEAYKLLCDELMNDEGKDSAFNFCMVGYGVANTLSENGTVSRGICDISENGYLNGVVERTKVKSIDGNVCYTEDGENWEKLSNDSYASMNCWGFTKNAVDELEARFKGFFEKNKENIVTAEYFLPSFVTDLINEGLAKVRVLRTQNECFGVTYREDLPDLRDKINNLTDRGVYTSPLWKEFK